MNEYNELTSLNHSILELFTIEELEDRLETDPIGIGKVLSINMLAMTQSTDTFNVDSVKIMEVEDCCLFKGCNENFGNTDTVEKSFWERLFDGCCLFKDCKEDS